MTTIENILSFLERGIPNATIQMTMKDKLINVIIMNENLNI